MYSVCMHIWMYVLCTVLYYYYYYFTNTTALHCRGKRTAKHKIIHKKTSLASTTDPDALLAIINENINVLDHFNLLHLQSDKEREDSDVSDIDDAVAMIRGGYSEYMHR